MKALASMRRVVDSSNATLGDLWLPVVMFIGMTIFMVLHVREVRSREGEAEFRDVARGVGLAIGMALSGGVSVAILIWSTNGSR